MKVATMIGVTNVSKAVQDSLTAEIGRVFDRPNAFTQRAIKRKPVRQGRLFAMEVFVQDYAGKGTAPEKYLAAEIYGGTRGDRKSVVEGKSVSGRVDLGGRRTIKKKNNYTK